jgi:hypothetical protein
MLIKANFATLDGLVGQFRATAGLVDADMAGWAKAGSAAEADWLDQAGGEFAEVRRRWDAVSDLQQQMIRALESATADARSRYAQTVAAGVAAVSG